MSDILAETHFWAGELFITKTRNESASVKWKAVRNRKVQATVATWTQANTGVFTKSAYEAKQATHRSAVHQLKA